MAEKCTVIVVGAEGMDVSISRILAKMDNIRPIFVANEMEAIEKALEENARVIVSEKDLALPIVGGLGPISMAEMNQNILENEANKLNSETYLIKNTRQDSTEEWIAKPTDIVNHSKQIRSFQKNKSKRKKRNKHKKKNRR